jgi:hypothetical protein
MAASTSVVTLGDSDGDDASEDDATADAAPHRRSVSEAVRATAVLPRTGGAPAAPIHGDFTTVAEEESGASTGPDDDGDEDSSTADERSEHHLGAGAVTRADKAAAAPSAAPARPAEPRHSIVGLDVSDSDESVRGGGRAASRAAIAASLATPVVDGDGGGGKTQNPLLLSGADGEASATQEREAALATVCEWVLAYADALLALPPSDRAAASGGRDAGAMLRGYALKHGTALLLPLAWRSAVYGCAPPPLSTSEAAARPLGGSFVPLAPSGASPLPSTAHPTSLAVAMLASLTAYRPVLPPPPRPRSRESSLQSPPQQPSLAQRGQSSPQRRRLE